MPVPILATKLYRPPARPSRVQRDRLIQRLDRGLAEGRRLTFISAPAGFGKTTLISEWIGRLDPQRPAAWISLDQGDNDPQQFMRYLVASLQQVDPAIVAEILPALNTHQVPALSDLIELLINAIFLFAKPFFLVLDDYHQISAVDIHQLVELLLERQPEVMHTVILTREDPLLPLARLRARGQVTEIRTRDLRFTELESTQFLRETMQLELDPQAVAILESRTEGWIAGLQLAAIALQEYTDHDSIQTFISDFAGSDRFIFDYLISEVILRQPDEFKDFMMRTSILERLCAPLCDALLSGDEAAGDAPAGMDSQFILECLERANLFIIPLDNRREWYRYHHLFGDLMQHYLKERAGGDITELHLRASRWFEANGFLQEAVSHTLKTRDWETTAQLVERHGTDLIRRSQITMLTNWCAAFPEKFVQSRPGICIFSAWSMMLTYRADLREAIEERLHQAQKALEGIKVGEEAPVGPGGAWVPIRAWVIGHVCAIRSQLLLAAFNSRVDPQELIALSMKSLELLPEVEKPIRATCAITLAHAHLMLADIENATNAFSEALRLAWDANNYFTVVTAYFYQARIAIHLGQLQRAVDICKSGLARLSAIFEHPDLDFPAIRSLYAAEAIVRLEWNDLDTAQNLLERTTSMTGWAPWVEIIAYPALVRLYEIQGNPNKVMATLNQLEKMGPQQAYCAEALRVLHLIRSAPDNQDFVRTAAAWADKHAPDAQNLITLQGIGPFHVDTEVIVFMAWVQVMLALGRPQETLPALAALLVSAREKNLTHRVIQLGVYEALAHSANGNRKAAHETLAAVLAVAHPLRYHNVFNWGTDMLRLLAEVPASGAARDYARLLLASMQQTAGVKAGEGSIVSLHPPINSSLVEPLSERELEVLRLLAGGSTVPEIAKRLYLSPNTLKAHTQNIYAKLDVHSRVEAINMARKLGLI